MRASDWIASRVNRSVFASFTRCLQSAAAMRLGLLSQPESAPQLPVRALSYGLLRLQDVILKSAISHSSTRPAKFPEGNELPELPPGFNHNQEAAASL